jgi:aryl-alcohol dehydrogenase-like predicted oxidoreductase
MAKIPPSLQASLDATKVEYHQLGSCGLRVSFPILGGMTFGSSPYAPWTLPEDKAIAVIKAAYDIGINTIDTANVYATSEEVIGKALRQHNIPRHKVVLMTKCAFAVGEDETVLGHAFLGQMDISKDYVNQGGRRWTDNLDRPSGC